MLCRQDVHLLGADPPAGVNLSASGNPNLGLVIRSELRHTPFPRGTTSQIREPYRKIRGEPDPPRNKKPTPRGTTFFCWREGRGGYSQGPVERTYRGRRSVSGGTKTPVSANPA